MFDVLKPMDDASLESRTATAVRLVDRFVGITADSELHAP